MFQNRAFQTLSCALMLTVCATAQAFTMPSNQPAQPLSMVEFWGPYDRLSTSVNPYYLGLASTDPTPIGYDETFFPYRSFTVKETEVYNAQLGKNVSEIKFEFRSPPGTVGNYQNITFTLDPDQEIGDVPMHQYNQFGSSGLPDIVVNLERFDTFYPSHNRFSIVDLQRDASGKIISMAGNFDLWGTSYRQRIDQQLTGRFWFNSAALNVPEPDTVALLLAGLATAGLLSRRKAAKAC